MDDPTRDRPVLTRNGIVLRLAEGDSHHPSHALLEAQDTPFPAQDDGMYSEIHVNGSPGRALRRRSRSSTAPPFGGEGPLGWHRNHVYRRCTECVLVQYQYNING
jgi:hypothetical protein